MISRDLISHHLVSLAKLMDLKKACKVSYFSVFAIPTGLSRLTPKMSDSPVWTPSPKIEEIFAQTAGNQFAGMSAELFKAILYL